MTAVAAPPAADATGTNETAGARRKGSSILPQRFLAHGERADLLAAADVIVASCGFDAVPAA